MRIVVIGGVAAGTSAASQAKRRAPQAEVVLFERARHVSYGSCGMPFNIADPARSMEDLVLFTPERFRAERGIEVRTRHEVLSIDPARRVVAVKALEGGGVVEEPYDRLVLATGATVSKPPLEGGDLPGVFSLRTLEDGARLKRFLADEAPQRAVVIGAGSIGLEIAEALCSRGLEVTVLEKLGQVGPGYEPEIVAMLEGELARCTVHVETGVDVAQIVQSEGGLEVRTDRGRHAAGLVVFATGVRPNVALAQTAGVALGETGAIAVDEQLGTSVAGILAAGDCVEAHHLLTGRAAYVPLGTTANKQGRVAGANAAGGEERSAGILGTSGYRVFGIEVARTGLRSEEIAAMGLDAVRAVSLHYGRALPGAREVQSVLFVERGSGKLLGAQMAGDNAAKRVDILAAALHAGMTVDQIERFDLTYSPPIAPVFDPVIIAARVAGKELAKAGR